MIQLMYDLANYFNQKQGRKYPCSNQIVICAYITDNSQEIYNYLDKNNIEAKKLIGYLPSEVFLYEDMSVKQMLDYHASFFQ